MNRKRTVITVLVVGAALAGVGFLVASGHHQGQAQQTAPFRGTEPSFEITTYNPLVRVNLTPTPLESIPVAISGSYRIIAPGSKKILAVGESLSETRITATAESIDFGGSTLAISEIEIVPDQSPAIWIGKHQYRGTVRVIRQPNQRLLAVNELPLEFYIASVVNGEMPATFPDSAREAQAIVARTYILSQMKGHPRFDVFATSRSQKYLGFKYKDTNGRLLAGESKSSRQVAKNTAGVVCTYKGKVFTTYYTAVCGGHTVNGRSVFTDAVPAIKSVTCNWCREADRYRWTNSMKLTEASSAIAKHLKKEGKTFGTLQFIKRVGSSRQSLAKYSVGDARNTFEIAGTTLRRALPFGILHSPEFTAEIKEGEVLFVGQGHGHGVGLCQWGARGLGLAGKNSVQILQYYYPTSSLVRLGRSSKL